MKTNKYTVISSDIITDHNLSVSSKGLYLALQAYLQSSNRKLNKNALFQTLPDHQIELDKAWDELLESGYLREYVLSDGHKEFELLDNCPEDLGEICPSNQTDTKKIISNPSQNTDEKTKAQSYALWILNSERESALGRHPEHKEYVNFLYDEMEDIMKEVGGDTKPGRKIQIIQSRIEDASRVRERILKIAPGDVNEILYNLPGGKKCSIERGKNLIRMALYSNVTDAKVVYSKARIKRIKRTTINYGRHRYVFDLLRKYID